MRKCLLLLTVFLVFCLTASAMAEGGFVFLTTDQLPFDTTAPAVPKYTLKQGSDVTLSGAKVTDQEYDWVYAEYQDKNGDYYGTSFTYDSATKTWIADDPDNLKGARAKDITLTFASGNQELLVKDHSFAGSYDGDDGMYTTDNKRQYWYGGDADPAKYDRAGNLERYSVNISDTDKNGNATYYVTYSAQGKVRGAAVDGADGKTYLYENGVWKTPKKDKDGNDVYDKDGNLQYVSSSAPKGYDLKNLKKYALELVQPKKQWFKNNTVGVRGFSLRERYPSLTDKWYHVVPVDLTKQGRQTFDLVASNLFILGHAYVDIRGDQLCVNYDYYMSDLAEPISDTIALFTSLDGLTSRYLDQPTGNVTAGVPLSISNDLGGNDTALLFFCNRLTYSQPYSTRGAMLTRFWPNHPRYAKDRAAMEGLMAKFEK